MNFFISERFSKILIFSGITLIGIFLFFFTYKAIIFNINAPIKADVFGQFGDIVGGVVGSLWALAGVLLFYTGLKEQRKDININRKALEKQIKALEVQKEEMSLLRQEYKMARKVFEQQKDALKEQALHSRMGQFESNFYSLLDIYINIRKALMLEPDSFIRDINSKIKSVNIGTTESKKYLEVINSHYLTVYYENKDKISHYLKTIYRIYKTIDEQTDLSPEKKYFYSKIVRSQFTEEELFLIYYNAQSHYGSNFRTLILKYNILKHLMLSNKVELKQLSSDNINANSKRHIIVSHLDKFIIKAVKTLYDLSEFENNISNSIKIGEHTVIIEAFSDQNDNFNIKLELVNHTPETLLNLSCDELKTFIECYLYDRFFNNKFEELSETDEIVGSFENNCFSFKIKTDKSLEIVKDSF